MKKRVIFYFDSRTLNRQWSSDTSTQAVSGTDSMMLDVSRRLSAYRDLDIEIASTTAPERCQMRNVVVGGITQAYDYCAATNSDFLVFNAVSTQEQTQLLAKVTGPVRLIAWAQCTPSYDWLMKAASSSIFHRLITVSNIQRNLVAHQSIFKKAVTIYNAIDTDYWSPAEAEGIVSEPYRITFVGALKPSKGFHRVAAIWREVRLIHPSATLMVCGSPQLYDSAAALGGQGIAEASYEREILQPLGGTAESAQEFGVHFLGGVSRQRVRKELASSQFAIVNPNANGSIETFCVSAAEAMAMGIPVVGGAAGALREVVGNNVGGLLATSLKELTLKICSLLDNPDLVAKLGQSARAKVIKHFQFCDVIPRWHHLLTELPVESAPCQLLNLKPRDFVLRSILRRAAPVSVKNGFRSLKKLVTRRNGSR